MADVGRDQVSVAETIGSLEWGIFGSAGMGESRLRGDYSCSELGQDGMGELEGAQNNWREGEADVEDGSEPVRDETDQRDVYLDELLSVIEDDPDSVRVFLSRRSHFLLMFRNFRVFLILNFLNFFSPF